MHEDIACNGCECMVITNTVFGVRLVGLGMVGQHPTGFLGQNGNEK